MKKLEIKIYPIEEAPKDNNVIMTWWESRPVLFAWKERMTKKYVPQKQKWYLPYVPDKVEVVDEGEWVFVRFNCVTGEYNVDMPCGLFKPKFWTHLPRDYNAVEIEQ